MSTIYRNKKRCRNCGRKSEQIEVGSTNEFGSRDLDFRPAPMLRTAMMHFIQECPFCHYSSHDIAVKPSVSKSFLRSEAYKTAEGHSFSHQAAGAYYRAYLIEKETGNDTEAFSLVQKAAWACDDIGDTENATMCRCKALELIDSVIEKNAQDAEHYLAIKASMLRRTKQFNQLIYEFESKRFLNEQIAEMIKFQIQKAKQADAKCYNIAHIEFEKKQKAISIREYQEADHDDVNRLLIQLQNHLVSVDDEKIQLLTEDYCNTYLDRMLDIVKAHEGKVFVAISSEMVIGAVLGIVEPKDQEDLLTNSCPKRGKILELIVDQDHRRLSIGHRLIDSIEAYFAEINCEYVAADVFAPNIAATWFYTRNGYKSRNIEVYKKLGDCDEEKKTSRGTDTFAPLFFGR